MTSFRIGDHLNVRMRGQWSSAEGEKMTLESKLKGYLGKNVHVKFMNGTTDLVTIEGVGSDHLIASRGVVKGIVIPYSAIMNIEPAGF